MSEFTTPLEAAWLGQQRYRITRPFEYHLRDYPSSDVITVPAGFVTDFASVPRFFHPIFPPDGPYVKAAVIHDYLYSRWHYSRLRSDQVFLEAMAVLKVSWWSRHLIYWAVRWRGDRSFLAD